MVVLFLLRQLKELSKCARIVPLCKHFQTYEFVFLSMKKFEFFLIYLFIYLLIYIFIQYLEFI